MLKSSMIKSEQAWINRVFFFFLDLLGVFFCIVPEYLGCAPCAFNEFPLLTKKIHKEL
jgi:hypothetical protein